MLWELSLSGLDLDFDPSTDEYTIVAPDYLDQTTVSAEAGLNGSVSISPADASGTTEGHQLRKGPGERASSKDRQGPVLAAR